MMVPKRVAIRDAVDRPLLSSLFAKVTEVEVFVRPDVIVEAAPKEDTSLLDDVCVAVAVEIVTLIRHQIN